MTLGKEWKRYKELIRERPKCFQNTGSIHIVTDESIIVEYQEETGKTVGVVYESNFNMMVCDLVYVVPGKYFIYERVLPTVARGSIVAVTVYGDRFVLLNQYRHSLRENQYSFVRGYAESGLTPEENVKKEIKEELGATAYNIKYLGEYVADSGLCGNKVRIYSCEINYYEEKKDYEGIDQVIELSQNELKDWIRNGKINDGFSLAGIGLYLNLQLCRKGDD